MKEYDEIVKLYREIGREFRVLGAEKVFLMNSRTNSVLTEGMKVESAVEGLAKKEQLQEQCSKMWPFLKADITLIDESSDQNMVNEIYEDGIVL